MGFWFASLNVLLHQNCWKSSFPHELYLASPSTEIWIHNTRNTTSFNNENTLHTIICIMNTVNTFEHSCSSCLLSMSIRWGEMWNTELIDWVVPTQITSPLILYAWRVQRRTHSRNKHIRHTHSRPSSPHSPPFLFVIQHLKYRLRPLRKL